eukprot:396843-Pelagomonas_calceolata.AAC.1
MGGGRPTALILTILLEMRITGTALLIIRTTLPANQIMREALPMTLVSKVVSSVRLRKVGIATPPKPACQ